MKSNRFWLVPALLAAIVMAAPQAIAKDVKSIKAGNLTITKTWTRATPKGSKVAGGFLTIENKGATADRLVGGSFQASGRVEIHEMAVVNDVMRMRELPDGLEIKPGQKVVLKPGSYHVMFMDLKRQLQNGETVEGTLVFKNAGTVNVTYEVGAMGMKTGHGGAHGKMKH